MSGLPPLVLHVPGGDRVAPVGTVIPFRGEVANGDLVEFNWKCYDTAGGLPCRSSDHQIILFAPSALVSVDTALLGVGLFRFELTATASRRVASYTATLRVIPLQSFPQPVLQIAIGSPSYGPAVNIAAHAIINAEDQLVLQASLLNQAEGSHSYVWDVSSPNQFNVTSSAKSISQGFLILPQDELYSGILYSFTATSGVSTATYRVYVNEPPMPGVCDVFPSHGKAMVTEFQVICTSWSDDSGGVLQYGFSHYVLQARAMSPILLQLCVLLTAY